VATAQNDRRAIHCFTIKQPSKAAAEISEPGRPRCAHSRIPVDLNIERDLHDVAYAGL